MPQKKLVMVAMLCCLFAGSMFASSITQTCTIAVTGVPYSIACPFNLFNPSFGTLNSVVLSLGGVGGSVIPEQTDTSSTLDFTFSGSTANIQLDFVGPDSILVADTSNACSGTVLHSSTNVSCTSTNFSGLTTAPVNAASLLPYEGVGVSSALFTASGQILGVTGSGGSGSAGNIFFGGDGSIGGTLTLVYNYSTSTSTPEPASLFLMGAGLVGLGVITRRKQRKI